MLFGLTDLLRTVEGEQAVNLQAPAGNLHLAIEEPDDLTII